LPTLSIFSTHDNIVHPKETSHLVRRGGRDVEVEGIAHLSILFSPVVAEHVASFLLEPGPAGPEAEVVATAPLSTDAPPRPARVPAAPLDGAGVERLEADAPSDTRGEADDFEEDARRSRA